MNAILNAHDMPVRKTFYLHGIGMSSANNKSRENAKTPRRSGINALKQIAQGTDLNEYFSPTEISQLAKTHPALRFKIRETGALARHQKEWIVHWFEPEVGIETLEEVHYFVTTAPTKEIALQHFVLADNAERGTIDSFLQSNETYKGVEDLYAQYERLKDAISQEYPHRTKGTNYISNWYSAETASAANAASGSLQAQTAASIDRRYNAFLHSNVAKIVWLLKRMARMYGFIQIQEMRHEVVV